MIPLLKPEDPRVFPDVRRALRHPNGLLAAGGDLAPERLISAYRRGIFPWYSPGDPILWWSPDPRTVLFPTRIHKSRSLRKRLRQQALAVTFDRAFAEVIRACATPRGAEGGTWIVPEMILAYEDLHRLGLAHSVDVWEDERLVGGLYGVAVGRVFYGESMFSLVDDASKVALVHLCQQLADWGFGLIDCQMRTDHLLRLGAEELSRAEFVALLGRFCRLPGRTGSWDDGERHFPDSGDQVPRPEGLERR
jgi:leucyl/phenylalanyl-tRNA--protein transferase